MIEIKITEEMHKRAEETAKDIPSFKLSYRGGLEANVIGCLGEYIVEDWLRLNNILFQDERGETTHDYRLLNNRTFDVKTKDRTCPMQQSYACTVSDYNAEHQQPDYYIFVSLQREKNNKTNDIRRFHTAFIVGGVKRNYFKKHSLGWKIGQIDPSNNWPVKFDCHNLLANNITSAIDVIEILKVKSPA